MRNVLSNYSKYAVIVLAIAALVGGEIARDAMNRAKKRDKIEKLNHVVNSLNTDVAKLDSLFGVVGAQAQRPEENKVVAHRAVFDAIYSHYLLKDYFTPAQRMEIANGAQQWINQCQNVIDCDVKSELMADNATLNDVVILFAVGGNKKPVLPQSLQKYLNVVRVKDLYTNGWYWGVQFKNSRVNAAEKRQARAREYDCAYTAGAREMDQNFYTQYVNTPQMRQKMKNFEQWRDSSNYYSQKQSDIVMAKQDKLTQVGAAVYQLSQLQKEH